LHGQKNNHTNRVTVNIFRNGKDASKPFEPEWRCGDRILVTTQGSLGDLYPFLSLALQLRDRGYDVVIGTDPAHREKIEKHGLEFARVGADWLCNPQVTERVRSWSLRRLITDLLLPNLRRTYEETLAAAEGADAIITMQANFAAGLVAEQKNIPWVSGIPFPSAFFSAYDPPVLQPFPGLMEKLRCLGPAFWKPAKLLIKYVTTQWARELLAFRKEIGLPSDPGFSAMAECRSPFLHLALFSGVLARKQRDWPGQTVLTGFAWYDRDNSTLPEELVRFLDAGEPPIVFSLGSAIGRIRHEQEFFTQSAKVARAIGRRAVLMVNKNWSGACALPPDVIAVEYAPFLELLPRSAAFVHHGGIGSTAIAMRTGCPQLVVPCGWDQYDNAARVRRLGLARILPRSRYTIARAAAELHPLITQTGYRERATAVAGQLEEEDGSDVAADAITALLRERRYFTADQPVRVREYEEAFLHDELPELAVE